MSEHLKSFILLINLLNNFISSIIFKYLVTLIAIYFMDISCGSQTYHWFNFCFFTSAALKGRACFFIWKLIATQFTFWLLLYAYGLLLCQRHNRILFVPCAALMVYAGRRMHEECRTQTSNLDNNTRDNICECSFILIFSFRFH